MASTPPVSNPNQPGNHGPALETFKNAANALVAAANALNAQAHGDPAVTVQAGQILDDYSKQAHNALIKK